MNQQRVKVVVAALTLSFAAAVNIAVHEGYTTNAVIPTEGDVPTYGYGSTVKPDGSRVRMGERTDPVNALKTMHAHLSREEKIFRDSLPGVEMTQAEYDNWMQFVYNFGTGNWMKSSMRRELLAGNPRAACDALLKYRYAAGYDCSTRINGQPNKRCWGVWTRQQERHAQCLEAMQ